jgi:transposase
LAKRDEITMNQRERKKLYIIRQVIERKLKQIRAAEILGLCVRQVRRLKMAVKNLGDVGVVQRSRGRESKRRTVEATKQKILQLCRTRYVGFGPTLIAEKISEEMKIEISKETVRKWMISDGLEYRKRRKRPHRNWRARKEHSGEMVQMDGSHHNWFEDRGPTAVLMAYIDDATGRAYARFYDHEGTMPALDSLRRYIRYYGIPCTLYLDRHTTYKSKKELTVEQQLLGLKEPLSQFGAAAERLGIKVIHAYSPQAKGRIERLFGTLQDRLVKEMKLHNISNIEEGNEFLKNYLLTFNKKFQLTPADKNDLHRSLPNGVNLEWILCRQKTRALRNDFTVIYEEHVFQLLDNVRAKRITVQESINGRFRLIHNGRSLKFKKISPQALRQAKAKKQPPTRPRKPTIPGLDHPWKKFRLPGSNPPLP